ncbi:MAG: hypothetical protein ACJ8G2_01330 [Burkholderiales bacterium]|jgi:hypothetical protein
MNKLLTALLFSAMGLSASVQGADQDSQSSQRDQSNTAQAKQDCSKLSGKEKDKCTQATPAGPVDMQTGAQQKGKSDVAKERDRDNKGTQAATDAPAQSNSAVGNPEERSPTGQAQTGANPEKSGSTTKDHPEQSQDTVGHPAERTTTGEAQTGQEPGKGVANKSQ